tara:strand:+ start:3006 stop:3272 length:267 start_codon:yes stop_codon:yes gene_type:complete
MADITSSSIEVSENGVIDREAQTVTDAVVAAGQDTSRNVDNESESSGKAEIPQNMEELLVEGNKLMEDIQGCFLLDVSTCIFWASEAN